MKRDNFDLKVPVAGPFFPPFFFYASCACALRFHHIKRALQFIIIVFFFSEQTVSRPLSQSAQLVVKRGRDHFFGLLLSFSSLFLRC